MPSLLARLLTCCADTVVTGDPDMKSGGSPVRTCPHKILDMQTCCNIFSLDQQFHRTGTLTPALEDISFSKYGFQCSQLSPRNHPTWEGFGSYHRRTIWHSSVQGNQIFTSLCIRNGDNHRWPLAVIVVQLFAFIDTLTSGAL